MKSVNFQCKDEHIQNLMRFQDEYREIIKNLSLKFNMFQIYLDNIE